jgi:glycosyltransferase involved in cell wall biosynthesis
MKLESSSSKDFDVILNYNTLISGYYVTKKLNLPMIYDLADDLPEMIANSSQIPILLRPLGRWIGRSMLKRNIAIAKKVTGITKTLQDNYSIPDEKFELIPNGVDTEVFKKVKGDLRERLGLEDSFVLGYVGVLREWVDLTPVYQAIKNLENVKLLIVGEEGMLKKNREMVRRYGVEDKVIFTGTISYTKVPQYISAMDVCLIPFKHNAISQNAVPLKLFEYMACERPVISTRLKGVMEVVGGMILYADTVDEYITQIRNLLENPDLADELKKNGKKFIEKKYNWKKITKKLEKVLLIT